MARPKKEVPPAKEHFVGIRLTEDLYRVIQNEADNAGLCIASFNAWAVSLAPAAPKRIDKATTLLLISSCNGVPPFPQISGRKESS